MKRYPSFEPPEYRRWECDPQVLLEFQAVIGRSPRAQAIAKLTPKHHFELYRGLVRTRLLDIALKRWVLQGVISKAWLGTGEEAVTVGVVHAMGADDCIGPMIRNEGACIERGIPIADVFRAYLATSDAGPRGRDLHHGSLAHGVVSPISHVGALVPVLAGMALAFSLRNEARVAITFVGDGSTRTGEFHEGLGLAAALSLPLVVVVQDNQVALGTLRSRHTKAPFEELAGAYGAAGFACDGNNVLDSWAAARSAIAHARSGEGPAILVAHTFRMGGHATHDEDEARRLFSAETFEHWGKRDPVGVYEEFLLSGTSLGLASRTDCLERLAQIETEVEAAIEVAAAEAREAASRMAPSPATVTDDVVSISVD